ncbi:hypothetical protein C9374_007436 [Naegleria lovaniensis]|uniref:Uncharacterized protein n=1 Tax=Naegleria lovaniensis TaxID=51637 RepID=A0AA88GH16_NAELO|nr:uncharacterized protein C9374_007436 [Naegleria lovaniensis]KAG2379297.1 hypothetical protein C9374_007436 [Naegleria lovaniensis]
MVNSPLKRAPNREENDFEEEETSVKKVKFSTNNDVNTSGLESSVVEDVLEDEEQPPISQNTSNSDGMILASGGEEATSVESSVEAFTNSNLKEAKRSLNQLNDRLEALMNRLSEKVNKLISAVQESSEARRDQLEQLMKEGEDLHRKNLETNGQLEKAKELAHQFSLE